MPVPEPKAPRKSAKTAIAPTVAPPKIVTVGIYRFSNCWIGALDRLNHSICIPESMSCFETDLASMPPTSTQVTAKKTQTIIKIAA